MLVLVNVVQVLYRLELAEHLKAGRGQQQRFQTGGGSFVFEKANDEATKQEEEYAANGIKPNVISLNCGSVANSNIVSSSDGVANCGYKIT
jgi:hypothetical protein